jgi:hypothetical protein
MPADLGDRRVRIELRHKKVFIGKDEETRGKPRLFEASRCCPGSEDLQSRPVLWDRGLRAVPAVAHAGTARLRPTKSPSPSQVPLRSAGAGVD